VIFVFHFDVNNDAVRSVICQGWYFTRMFKALGRSHYCIKMEVWAHQYSLFPPLMIEVSVPSQEIARSCIHLLGVPILILHFGIVPTVRCFVIVLTLWYFGIVPKL
jgi:hypothetical protein